MRGAVEYPLNPVDHILLAVHESLRRRGYCGLNGMLVADVEGPLATEEVAASLRRLGRAYPALSARVGFSRILRRAHWRIDADAPLEDAVEYRPPAPASGASDADAPLRRAFTEPFDPTRGPQLRLVHVRSADDRHRLALVWAHHLMDLEGGHLLLRELDAALHDKAAMLGRDLLVPAPRPYRSWFPKSYWRVWQGRLHHLAFCLAHQPRIVPEQKDRSRTANFECRRYGAAFRERFEALARQRTTAGPMRYSRAFMIAAARAYLEMCRRRGRPRDRYLFMQVLRLPRTGGRPHLHGNHVSIPWVAFGSAELARWPAADAAASRQLRDFTQKQRDEAQWEMFRATRRWPFALARYFAAHRLPRGAAGFSSYRFGNVVTHLGRARIVNLVQITTMSCHPGWILSESTFGEGLSVSIGFFEDYIDPQSVSEFLDRLECHLAGRDGRSWW